jgi:hypothetical protein
MTLPYTLGHISKGASSTSKRDTCTPMSIAALVTIAKLWNQHRCPTTDEWRKKVCNKYMMESYSAIEKKIMSFARKWMELENIILSGIS